MGIEIQNFLIFTMFAQKLHTIF